MTTEMTIEEILEHNRHRVEQIQYIHKELDRIRGLADFLKKEIIPPCKFCPYDGVYRCEACEETMFEGFNKKDFFDGGN